MAVEIRERREQLRTTCKGTLEINHSSTGIAQLRMKDMSDHGVYVMLGSYPALPVGTTVKGRIKLHTGIANIDPMDMTIVRHYPGGMALQFTELT